MLLAGSLLSIGALVAVGPESAITTQTRPGAQAATASKAVLPKVIGHRGAPGHRPEHTLEGYELAVRLGADAIEPDLVMTSDGVLVARHGTELAVSTDVASHPEFANRRTTRSGTTGWFVFDFTLAELKTLRAREPSPALRPVSATFDGRFSVPTFDEVLDLRARLAARLARPITVVPEIKGWAVAHERGMNPEAALVAALERHGLNRPGAPVWTQSAQWTPLVDLRSRYGYHGHLVLLTFATGGPSDLTAAGTPRSDAELLTEDGLKDVARIADAVATDKDLIIPRGSDGHLGTPTHLVANAAAAGLRVFAFTFRAENSSLPVELRVGTLKNGPGRTDEEARTFLRAGVAALFCDHPELCARAAGQATVSPRHD